MPVAKGCETAAASAPGHQGPNFARFIHLVSIVLYRVFLQRPFYRVSKLLVGTCRSDLKRFAAASSLLQCTARVAKLLQLQLQVARVQTLLGSPTLFQ